MTDLNDVDALIQNLVDALNKAVVKGIKVRVDENEMVVMYEDVERVRVPAVGEITKKPLSSLLRHLGESQAEAAKRVVGDA